MRTFLLSLALLGLTVGAVRAAEEAGFYSLPIEEYGGKRLDSYGPDNSWSSVPLDLQTYGGVPFQVVSKLQLQGTGDAKDNRFYPSRATGIPVGQRAARLHVLHAGNMTDRDGRPIAALRINYADGHTHTLFLTYGVHVRDWWKHPNEADSSLSDTNSAVVWTGTSEDGRRNGATHRLFKTSFNLPKNDQPVESIDALSLFSRCSPILFSLTIETPRPGVRPSSAIPSADDSKFRDELSLEVSARDGQPLGGTRVRGTALDERGTSTPLGRLDDTGQRPGIVPVDFPAGTRTLRLVVAATAHAPAELELKAGPEGRLPRQASVQLESGARISGFVRAPDGTPLPKAKVGIFGQRRDAAGLSSEITYDESTTDAQGRWKTQAVPQALENLRFKVAHADFRAGEFDVADQSTKSTVTRDALLAGEASFVLAAGINVRGVVQDPSGNPIARAEVTLMRGDDLKNRDRRATDVQGRFNFVVIDPADASLLVQHADFAPYTSELSIGDDFETLQITLKPGVPLKGRVMQTRGPASTNLSPVAGVAVTVTSSKSPLLRWTGTTDNAGRFVWEQAPPGSLRVETRRSGFAPRIFNAASGPEENEFVLAGLSTLWGRAVDVETKQPILAFTVTLGESWSEDRVSWRPDISVKGRDGEFALTDPNGGRSGGRTVLKAEASGYWPGQLYVEARGLQTNVFELRRGVEPRGVVKQPDGQPAAGAEIAVIGEDYLTLGKGAFGNQRSRSDTRLVVKSDSAGGFQLPLRLSQRVVLVHEQGYAETTLSNLAAQTEITLLPWGAVEGTVMIGSKPATNSEVKLNENRSSEGLQYDYKEFDVKADSEGKFRFTHVPPGSRWLVRLVPTRENSRAWSHQTPVTVEPGKVARVTVGGTGRAVIGKVVADDPARSIIWSNGNHSLGTLQPKPPPFKSAEEYRAWSNTPEVKADREAYRYYAVVFAGDGSFRADDVPPGKYQLRFWFTEPRERNQPNYGGEKTIGQLNREFEIDPIPGGRTDEPLDLGTLNLQTRRVAGLDR